MDCLDIVSTCGLVDPPLELEDHPFAVLPGDGLPFISRHEAGAMTYPLLLAALPSNSPGPRQHILGVTPGLGFLGHPLHAGLRATPALRVGESTAWVPPFLMSVLRSRRAVLSTGFVGSEYWSDAPLPAPILSLLGKPGLTRVGLFWVTMGQRTFARAAPSSSLPGVIPSGSGLALFYPRFTD